MSCVLNRLLLVFLILTHSKTIFQLFEDKGRLNTLLWIWGLQQIRLVLFTKCHGFSAMKSVVHGTLCLLVPLSKIRIQLHDSLRRIYYSRVIVWHLVTSKICRFGFFSSSLCVGFKLSSSLSLFYFPPQTIFFEVLTLYATSRSVALIFRGAIFPLGWFR